MIGEASQQRALGALPSLNLSRYTSPVIVGLAPYAQRCASRASWTSLTINDVQIRVASISGIKISDTGWSSHRGFSLLPSCLGIHVCSVHACLCPCVHVCFLYPAPPVSLSASSTYQPLRLTLPLQGVTHLHPLPLPTRVTDKYYHARLVCGCCGSEPRDPCLHSGALYQPSHLPS